MMGDRDYRTTIKNAIDSIGRELEIEIDADDFKTINLIEVVKCMRRSYYDRTDPKEIERRGFNDLLSGLLRKLEYGCEPKEFSIDDIKLKGQADMIVDDNVILFRASQTTPDSPHAEDLLYLNACLWIYDKTDGMIIYITSDREEFTFSLTRDKKMFEEVVRRVRVLSDLLKEQKTPILEPSQNCLDCQYYQRCFISKASSKQLSLSEMLGLSKEN
jgi:CRISPR-associated exonuclease Cas4